MSASDKFPGPIAPDDIEPGMIVTILHTTLGNDEPEAPSQQPQQGMVVLSQGGGGNPPSGRDMLKRMEGHPFFVAEVCFPYIACVHIPDGHKGVFDARDAEFMEVTDTFASFFADRREWKQKFPSLFEDSPPEGVQEMASLSLEETFAKGLDVLAKVQEAQERLEAKAEKVVEEADKEDDENQAQDASDPVAQSTSQEGTGEDEDVDDEDE